MKEFRKINNTSTKFHILTYTFGVIMVIYQGINKRSEPGDDCDQNEVGTMLMREIGSL